MNFYEYIIVGGGPSGVQMGYFLEQAGRDYMILDRAERVGTFFENFPRHRKLNSFNKVNNWFEEPDFNLRFDWHTFLTHDDSFRFRGYSDELFPDRASFAKYIQDFREHFGIKVTFNTNVTYIDRDPETRHFIISTEDGEEYRCRTLLMGTGPVKPKLPAIEGIEHATTYVTQDPNPETYRNKRVVVIGGGISAFETANNLAAHAAAITVLIGKNHMRHAWRTHFAGDLRVSNNVLLDMSALKMMHGIYQLNIKKIVKQDNGVLHVHYEEEFPHWKNPGVAYGWMPVDHVISCTGWQFIDADLFAPSIRPQTIRDGAFGLLNSSWETTTPDLFVIGMAGAGRYIRSPTLTHHGFRYTVRALSRILESRYENTRLPSKVFPMKTRQDLEALGRELINRVSLSSGLFHCNAILTDAVVFDTEKGEAEFFYEIPVDYCLENPYFNERPVIYVTLELGFNNFPDMDPNIFVRRNDPSRTGCVGVIHPVFRFYKDGVFAKGSNSRGSIGSRYDEAYEGFEYEEDDQKTRNVLLNFLNEVAQATDYVYPEEHFHNTEERGGFRLLREGEVLANPGLPECALEVGGQQVGDFSHFRQVSRRPDGTIPPWVHAKTFEIDGIH